MILCPSLELHLMLEALCRPPFEPIKQISDRLLILKSVFLIVISSLKRVRDLQALSLDPSYLDFAPGLAKAFLYPRAGYVPKVPSSHFRLYCHLPSGSPTRSGLIVCVQCEH